MKPLGLFQDALMVPGVETLTDAQCRVWYRLICLAATQRVVGAISVGEARMAETVAGGDANLLTETLARLESIGCIDVDHGDGYEVVILKVTIRQRSCSSKTSTERVNRYRAKVRAAGETVTGYVKHRAYIYSRDGGACVYCGTKRNLVLDHLIPVNRGGPGVPDNLVTACKGCNSGKSGRLIEECGYKLRTKASIELYERAKLMFPVTPVTLPVTGAVTLPVTVTNPLSPSFPPSDSPSFAPAPPRDGSRNAHAREEIPQTDTPEVQPVIQAPTPQTPPSPRAADPPLPTGRETPEGMLAYLLAIDDVDPGAHSPTPAQAEATLRLIWNSFPENREALTRGYWQRQCCHSDVAWRAAIKATLRSQPNIQSIRYIETIAARNPDGEPERAPVSRSGPGRPQGGDDVRPLPPVYRLTPEELARAKRETDARKARRIGQDGSNPPAEARVPFSNVTAKIRSRGAQ